MNTSFEGTSRKGKNEWLTPLNLLNKLGEFDLDPCSPVNRPWNTAKHHYTLNDDGLKKEWFGRVWCNPPYETDLIKQFIEKCIAHKNCIALTFARTDTKLFHDLIFKHAHSILFIKGRISFYHVTGEVGGPAGAPSCLISFNQNNSEVLQYSGISGTLLQLK